VRQEFIEQGFLRRWQRRRKDNCRHAQSVRKVPCTDIQDATSIPVIAAYQKYLNCMISSTLKKGALFARTSATSGLSSLEW